VKPKWERELDRRKRVETSFSIDGLQLMLAS
jgi:hypothetical protein